MSSDVISDAPINIKEKLVKKFNFNILKTLCQTYNKNVKIITNNEKNKNVYVYNINENNEIANVIKTLNKIENVDEFNNKIKTPILHTLLDYFTNDTYKENLDDTTMLNDVLNIKPIEQKETFYKYVNLIVEWFTNQNNVNVKLFNTCFSPFYKKFYNKDDENKNDFKNIRLIYLQKNVNYIVEIINEKHNVFTSTVDDIVKMVYNKYVENMNKTTKKMFNTKYTFEYMTSENPTFNKNEKLAYDIYRDLVNTRIFAEKLDVFEYYTDFEECYEKYMSMLISYKNLCITLSKIKRTMKEHDVDTQYNAFVKVIYSLIEFYNFKDSKEQTLKNVLSHIKKLGVKLNFRDNNFKKTIIECSSLKDCEHVVDNFKEYLEKVLNSTTTNFYDMKIYKNIGFYVYKYVDNCDIIKLNNSQLIAIGVTIFYYINEHIKTIHNKKNITLMLN